MNTTTFPRMHVSLYVSDLQRSIQFYTRFFGQEANKLKPGYAKFILEKPSLIISFIENPERVQSNFGHLGFQVETQAELEKLQAIAQTNDLVNKVESGTACCYAKQDKFWAVDPDGVQWEVYYFHEDAEFNDPHYENQETQNCCSPQTLVKPAVTETKSSCCSPAASCC